MSISRLQNDQENERRWAEEQELAKLRAENERLRAAAKAVFEVEWGDIGKGCNVRPDLVEMSDREKKAWLDLEAILTGQSEGDPRG